TTSSIYTLSLHDALPILSDHCATGINRSLTDQDAKICHYFGHLNNFRGAVDLKGDLMTRQAQQRTLNFDATTVVANDHGVRHTRSEEHTSELQSRFDLVC